MHSGRLEEGTLGLDPLNGQQDWRMMGSAAEVLVQHQPAGKTLALILLSFTTFWVLISDAFPASVPKNLEAVF